MQPRDKASLEVVVGADDAQFPALDQGRERAVMREGVRNPQDLGADDLVDEGGLGYPGRERRRLSCRCRSRRRVERGPQPLHDCIEVARQVRARLDGVHGGGDRAAPLMAHDDDKWRAVL